MPTPLATEKVRSPLAWTKDAKDQLVWTGSRVFQVSDATDWDDAEAIMVAQHPTTAEGATHPQGHGATVTGVSRDRVSAGGFYELTVSYSSGGGDDPEVLLTPPEIQHEPYEYFEQSDVDVNGVPYVNTGNFPFEGGIPIPRMGFVTTIGRWETPASIISRNFTFGSKVNDGDYTFPDGEVVPDKLCLFKGCFKRRRNTNSLHNWVEYIFDSRETGHQHNVPDMGALGYYVDQNTALDASGIFVYSTATGPSPTGPVRLDGAGRPMAAGVQVAPAFPSDAEPQPPVSYLPVSPSAALINATLSNANVNILTFDKRKAVSFAGLL